MLTRKKIEELLGALNEELGRRGVMGEVGICGGAVMCLVFNAREATKDVDAIFREYYPRKVIPPKTQYFIEEIFDAPAC